MSAIGTVAAVQGVTVSADLPGIVERIAFESGPRGAQRRRAGDARHPPGAGPAGRRRGAARPRPPQPRPHAGPARERVISQADFDRAAADSGRATPGSGRSAPTIARKTIRAPFSGVLGIRQVNLGQYLAPGAPMVPLQSLDPIYVDFDVPQQPMAGPRRGAPSASPRDDAGGKESTGRITAVDSVVDPATRNFQVQATFANPAARCVPACSSRPGSSSARASRVLVAPGLRGQLRRRTAIRSSSSRT